MRTILLAIAVTAVAVWISRMLMRGPQKSVPAGVRNTAALTQRLNKSAILLAKSGAPSGSYLGGMPPHYPGFVWPVHEGSPLSFLACITLEELPRTAEMDWLPAQGRLLFFYDIEHQPWGFDPKDAGGWRVLYVAAAVAFDGVAQPPRPLSSDQEIPKRFVRFSLRGMPPSPAAREIVDLRLSDVEQAALDKNREALFDGQPHHQIAGYPDPIQGDDMDLECQLVSNGIYCGNANGYTDPRVASLREEAADWSLLFQMDSDDELRVMWEDTGMLYFWIRREDARACRFDKTWLILQCY